MMVTYSAGCCDVISSGKSTVVVVLRAEVGHGSTIEVVVRCEKSEKMRSPQKWMPLRPLSVCLRVC